MSIFGKDPYDILMEACRSECGECDDLVEDEIEREIEDEYVEVEELEEELPYTAEMVNVIEQSIEGGNRYLIDIDDLAKFMEKECEDDPLEALKKIAKANNLEESSMHVVIESDDFIEELLTEAKADNKAGSKKKLGKVSGVTKLLKDIKNKGIKVLKKKSKKVIKEGLFGGNKNKNNAGSGPKTFKVSCGYTVTHSEKNSTTGKPNTVDTGTISTTVRAIDQEDAISKAKPILKQQLDSKFKYPDQTAWGLKGTPIAEIV